MSVHRAATVQAQIDAIQAGKKGSDEEPGTATEADQPQEEGGTATDESTTTEEV